MQKVDAIIEANPGVSLDDLVASRKINADQKASALKKPQLQAQLRQVEEQVAQYKKFDQEYQEKIAQEKQILQQSHTEELSKLRDTMKAEAALEAQKTFRESFLTLSRFLRAAASRRQLEEDDSDLTKAFEGALLLVYGGDATAVEAAEKLISGSSDNVPSTEGVPLNISCTCRRQTRYLRSWILTVEQMLRSNKRLSTRHHLRRRRHGSTMSHSLMLLLPNLRRLQILLSLMQG